MLQKNITACRFFTKIITTGYNILIFKMFVLYCFIERIILLGVKGVSKINMKEVHFSKPTLSASVSCMDFFHLQEQICEIEESPISFFHYDVVDGVFNRCFILGETLLEQMASKTRLPIEVHLAVYHPELYLERFIKSGADYIGVQYEAMDQPLKIFDQIRKYGAEPVLCLKSTTPPDERIADLAKEAAWVLKLTVNPGFSGQKIQPEAIRHIRFLAELLKEKGIDTPIQADGNVNLNTIGALSQAGADIFTGGSSGLFQKGDSIQKNAWNLLNEIKNNTNGNIQY